MGLLYDGRVRNSDVSTDEDGRAVPQTDRTVGNRNGKDAADPMAVRIRRRPKEWLRGGAAPPVPFFRRRKKSRCMVNRYNEIYRVQMPNITPHVCRHTYCSNQAKAGMNPKTLQYLMGHSDIGVTLNVYTHLGLEDAAAEMARMEAIETARKEQEKIAGKKDTENTVTQKMFRVV